MEKTSINKRYIKLIKKTYINSRAKIKTDLGISEFIQIRKSVKQGDKLAWLLLCIVIASVIFQTEEQNPDLGVSIGGKLRSNLAYADVKAILEIDTDKLQVSINDFTENAKKLVLCINICKTKTMAFGKNDRKV